MSKNELLAYLAGQFAEYATETNVAITDDPRTFRPVINQAMAHGEEEATVKPLGIFYALRRFRAAYLNAGISLPETLEDEIKAAREAVAKLPFDPPLSV
jgi:hypothetical protein